MASLLLRLRGLSPLGPIFGKELRTTARLKRTYVLRFLYLAALLLVLLFCFLVLGESYSVRGGGVARRAQMLAEMGAVFFIGFAFFTILAMLLVGPVLTATAINSERLHKTLPVLLMTPITAWQIVSGKLFSRLLIALTLIGLSLPALSVVRLLGGVEVGQIIAALALSASAVLFAAALGLLLSTLMNRAYAVILLSYALMGVLYLLVPLVLALSMELSSARGPNRERVLVAYVGLTNPVFDTAMLAVPGGPKAMFGWEDCALLHTGMAGVLLVLSALVLRRSAKRDSESRGAGDGGAGERGTGEGGTGVSPVADTDHGRDAHATAHATTNGAARSVSDNPVLWRELRRPLTGRPWQAVTLATACVLVLLVIYWLMGMAGALGDNDAQVGFGVVFWVLLTLLTCVVSATAIAQEKESDTWTLLLATPLPAWRIVLAKAAGLMRRLMWPGILIVAHFVLFTVAGVLDLATFCIILWLIFTSSALWLASGLYLSLRLRTVTFAVVINLMLPVLIYLGVFVVLGILGAVLEKQHYANDTGRWAEAVGLYCPAGLIPPAVEYLRRGANYNEYNYYASAARALPNPEVYLPYLRGQAFSFYIRLVVEVGVIYLLLAGLILGMTSLRFDRIVGRAAQKWRAAGGPTLGS